jgi:hypothetical protein
MLFLANSVGRACGKAFAYPHILPRTKWNSKIQSGNSFEQISVSLILVATSCERWFSSPSDPPSEEGSPGEVRSRCPTTAAYWPASFATGPAGLPQRGVSAGFRKANLLALCRANGRDSGEPSAIGPGRRGALLCVLSCANKKVGRPPGRVPAFPQPLLDSGFRRNDETSKSRRWRYGELLAHVLQHRLDNPRMNEIPRRLQAFQNRTRRRDQALQPGQADHRRGADDGEMVRFRFRPPGAVVDDQQAAGHFQRGGDRAALARIKSGIRGLP